MLALFQRIARDRLDAEHWFDYGTYNLYINDIEKAEECFKVRAVAYITQHATSVD